MTVWFTHSSTPVQVYITSEVSYAVWRAPHAICIKDIRDAWMLTSVVQLHVFLHHLQAMTIVLTGRPACLPWCCCVLRQSTLGSSVWLDPPRKQLVLSGCCTGYSIEGWVDNFVLWPYPPASLAGRPQSYPFSAAFSLTERSHTFPSLLVREVLHPKLKSKDFISLSLYLLLLY